MPGGGSAAMAAGTGAATTTGAAAGAGAVVGAASAGDEAGPASPRGGSVAEGDDAGSEGCTAVGGSPPPCPPLAGGSPLAWPLPVAGVGLLAPGLPEGLPLEGFASVGLPSV